MFGTKIFGTCYLYGLLVFYTCELYGNNIIYMFGVRIIIFLYIYIEKFKSIVYFNNITIVFITDLLIVLIKKNMKLK